MMTNNEILCPVNNEIIKKLISHPKKKSNSKIY